MRVCKGRLMRAWVLFAGLIPLTGCVLVADVLQDGFITDLGLDPASISRSPGTMLVAFNNRTPYTATFYAFAIRDASTTNPGIGSRNMVVPVEGNTVENEVLECPYDVVSAGQLGADVSFSDVAVDLQITTATEGGTETNEEQVSYLGPFLENGVAYRCGDVIEIRLFEDATQEEVAFRVTMSVIPGQ